MSKQSARGVLDFHSLLWEFTRNLLTFVWTLTAPYQWVPCKGNNLLKTLFTINQLHILHLSYEFKEVPGYLYRALLSRVFQCLIMPLSAKCKINCLKTNKIKKSVSYCKSYLPLILAPMPLDCLQIRILTKQPRWPY